MLLISPSTKTWFISQLDICNKTLINVREKRFPSGELYLEILNDIAGKEVNFLHTLHPNCHEKMIELLICLNALQQAKVASVKLILPYICYSRLDKSELNQSFGIGVITSLLNTLPITELITFDPHSSELENNLKVPLKIVSVRSPIISDIGNRFERESVVLINPDQGRAKYNEYLGEILAVPRVSMQKERYKDGTISLKTSHLNLIKDKNCVIVDDIVDSGSTVLSISKLLKANGAKTINVYATHGIFSTPAPVLLKSGLTSLTIFNTIPQTLTNDKYFRILSIKSEIKSIL